MNGRRCTRRPRERDLRVETVPRQSPDLHKLAQVFLGMAVARAESETQRGKDPACKEESAPMQEDDADIQ